MRMISTGNVGIGTNDPKTLLRVKGKSIIDSTLTAAPSNGLYGSNGTRLILWPGAPDGITGGTLWYSVPTGAIHAFYIGTTERMRINTSGFVEVNTMTRNVIYKLMELELLKMVVL
jgi:hypothetical protein